MSDFVAGFRNSAPYIRAHRGRTFVILIAGEVIDSSEFNELIHDIALLNTLGVRQVLLHGQRPQIQQRLQQRGLQEQFYQGIRVTDVATLACVKETTGSLRLEIEALLSMGVANSPMAGAGIRVASGNFILAKPHGIRAGIDYQYTGEVRRINAEAIQARLQEQEIVLLSPVGYSPTGEVFNLIATEVAYAVASALQADKIILLHNEPPLCEKKASLRELSPTQAEQLFNANTNLSPNLKASLQTAIRCCRAGVPRAHLVNAQDGGLLSELFTRDGVGTLITSERYESLRRANIEDVGGILELIEPLEAQGILVRRSRSQLETEIESFCVIERDGMITACAALYPFRNEKAGELACLAVHPAYQGEGRGDRLLSFIITEARKLPLQQIFVLTTRTAHWFLERGFRAEALEQLPIDRKAAYNYRRNSQMLLKFL